ncbi:MAG: hypothetical protein ACW964_16370 [Candidatus Hodarchaeales archaeon]|jgi:hypothetical protein
MINFSVFKRSCIQLDKDRCNHFSHFTQCHILNCPLFSQTTPIATKKAIRKQLAETIKFSVQDFDSVKQQSTLDLIQQAKKKKSSLPPKKRLSKVIIKPIERLVCFRCDKHITNENYSCFTDNQGNMLYFHTSEECRIPKSELKSIRETFLKNLKRKREPRLFDRIFEIEKRLNKGIDEFVLSIKAILPNKQNNTSSIKEEIIIKEEIKKKVLSSHNCFICGSTLTLQCIDTPIGVICFCPKHSPKTLTVIE